MSDETKVEVITKESFILAELVAGKKLKEAEEAWKNSGNAIQRRKGGRAAFYDYLRENSITSEKELIAYIASDDCEFSENERKTSNYGHWLAIAELVESVRNS